MLIGGLGFLERAAAGKVHTATERVKIPKLEMLRNTVLASFIAVRHLLQVCTEH